MYEFIDVNQKQPRAPLPAEALKINGNFIENMIDGYRTLYVEGREILPSELIGSEADTKDGFVYRGRRYPERRITVTYQLKQKSAYEFRDAFNMLNGILCKENSELIFNDEPDMYFIGTLEEVDSVEPGTNNTVGSFSFVCADPFKYSVNKIATNVIKGKNVFDINYRGTHCCYPNIIVKANSDLGYVVFINEKGNSIQVGNVEEVDTVPAKRSEQLVDYAFTKEGYNPADWKSNIAVPVYTKTQWTQEGSVKSNGRSLVPSGGSGVAEGWHGPSITMQLPANSSGHVGAKNWKIEWQSKVRYDYAEEFGDLEILVTGVEKSQKVNVAAICCWKSTSNSAFIGVYSKGKVLKNIEFDKFIYGGTYSYSIEKFGEKLYFSTPNGNYEYYAPEVENIEAKEISILFGSYNQNKPLTLEVSNIKFKAHSVDYQKDVPNSFSKNDVIEINCESGDIFVNNIEHCELGSVYNDWDGFFLEAGSNNFNVNYSPWAENPDITFVYRKAML